MSIDFLLGLFLFGGLAAYIAYAATHDTVEQTRQLPDGQPGKTVAVRVAYTRQALTTFAAFAGVAAILMLLA